MGVSYQPRFFVSSSAIAPLKLNALHIEILFDHYRHEYLDTDLVLALRSQTPKDGWTVRGHLQQLFRSGHIGRIDDDISLPNRTYLRQRGLTALQDHLERVGKGPLPRDRVHASASATQYLSHQLGTSGITVSMELMARQLGRVRFIDQNEIFAGASKRVRRARAWPVEIADDDQTYTTWVRPDAFFGLEFADRPSGRNKRYFILEYDRGKMPIARTTLHQSSCRRKYLAYTATFEKQLIKRYFGIDYCNILFVTTFDDRRPAGRQKGEWVARALKRANERREKMCAAAVDALNRRNSNALGTLYFASHLGKPRARTTSLIGERVWLTAKGREVALPL